MKYILEFHCVDTGKNPRIEYSYAPIIPRVGDRVSDTFEMTGTREVLSVDYQYAETSILIRVTVGRY